MERTQKVNRHTYGRLDIRIDGRTDGGHDIIRPVFDGLITIKCVYETLLSQPYACPERRFKSEGSVTQTKEGSSQKEV